MEVRSIRKESIMQKKNVIYNEECIQGLSEKNKR
jgi:hypothetical protein